MRYKLLLSFIALFTLCTEAFAVTVHLAANTWSPYVDQKLPKGGLALDLVKEAFKRAGYQTTMTYESWPRTLEGVKIGVMDVIAAAWYTDERAMTFTFSEPYLFNEIKFIKRKDLPLKYSKLQDLSGLTVGIVRKYAYGDEFAAAKYIFKAPQNHLIQNLAQLIDGRIDLTLDDHRVIEYQLNRYFKSGANKLEFLPKSLTTRGLHIAVSKKNPDHQKIAEAFNKAIKEMKADGTYQKILEQH